MILAAFSSRETTAAFVAWKSGETGISHVEESWKDASASFQFNLSCPLGCPFPGSALLTRGLSLTPIGLRIDLLS